METSVAAVIVMIVASAAYSYYKQATFSIIVCVVCAATYIVQITSSSFSLMTDQLGFMAQDLLDPDRIYTPLTSMYTHAGANHLFFNLLVLAFMGAPFEQKIGTRPFILVYFICGLSATVAFAIVNWNEYAIVVGASGAISGVLGAFVRLYPYERFSILFLPSFTLRLWVVVVGLLLMQLVFLAVDERVAVESHLGGLIVGMFIIPFIVKIPLHKRVKRMVSQTALRRLATTPELKTIMRRIEDEEIPDVRSAWIEHFIAVARCPVCGAKLKARKEGVMCERGHML
jgi:membrane associated rhomboid family serine protease